jgi:hypothetical protein
MRAFGLHCWIKEPMFGLYWSQFYPPASYFTAKAVSCANGTDLAGRRKPPSRKCLPSLYVGFLSTKSVMGNPTGGHWHDTGLTGLGDLQAGDDVRDRGVKWHFDRAGGGTGGVGINSRVPWGPNLPGGGQKRDKSFAAVTAPA